VQAESENAATLPLILAVQFTPGFGDGEVLMECSDIGTLGSAHATDATIVALPVPGITNHPSP
jgi:hypothetical protein